MLGKLLRNSYVLNPDATKLLSPRMAAIHFMWVCVWVLFANSIGSPSCQARESVAETQPNILFIYLDDFGWRDTGFMGSDFYETPVLDSLAAEGMVFDNAYSAAANCAPARACLMSGQYTPRHKIYNVGTKPRGKTQFRRLEHVAGRDVLDPRTTTWAQRLQGAGYRTGIFGKWHLSGDPVPYGFDANVGGTQGGGPPNGYYPPHGKAPGLNDAPSNEYLTDRLTSESISFIEASQDQPWCVFLSHFAVHTPLDAKRELLAKYNSKPAGKLHQHVKMATMIEAVDTGVGRILQTLESLDQRQNTVIVFYSDNGGYGPATDMDPLKGYKGTYYEGGIRVPLFVCWPGKIQAGTKCSLPVTGVDLYPTLCQLGGVNLDDTQAADGKSILPLLMSEPEAAREFEERSIFWHFPAYLQAYQVWDEQRDPLFRSRPCSVIRKGNWKLHQYFEDGGLELYDLASDIGESKNLATSHPEKTEQLLSILKEWQRTVDADIPVAPNPEFDAQAEQAAIDRKRNKR